MVATIVTRYRGVSQVGRHYQSRIQVRGLTAHLGMFQHPEDAELARELFALRLLETYDTPNYELRIKQLQQRARTPSPMQLALWKAWL